jgi:hypothetical protein
MDWRVKIGECFVVATRGERWIHQSLYSALALLDASVSLTLFGCAGYATA